MNRKHLILVITVLLCYLSMLAPSAFAALTAQLDRDRISEGETVRLTIEAGGRVSAMPDTRPLNQDFDVTGTMSGSRVNIVNGKMDTRTTWTISLIPKHSGTLIIPPLNINGEYTPELTLQVADASASTDPDAAAPVFLETEVDKTDPYVQGMVRYTQRVFFAVNLAQGTLSEPEHENALVHKLGEDREYLAQRNGRSYNVIEREFAVFPQNSGKLVLPAPVLNAQIPDNTSRHDPFFDRFFSDTRPVRLRGEAITLDVRPRPSQSKSIYWLPAEAVELHETWQPEDNQINFGDPVTRTLTIKALGVTGEQLPDLKLTDPEGFKLYPDRAQSSTQNLQNTLQGEKTLRLAYIPTQPGKHTLPAFTLRWWDTVTDSEQVATLPERTLEVLPAAGQQQNPAAAFEDFTAESDETGRQHIAPGLPKNPLLTDRTANTITTSALNHSGWFWASLLFATLWLITLRLWWNNKRHRVFQVSDGKKISSQESENSRKARKHFLTACKDNNPQQARHFLLKWAACHWPDSPPKGLEELSSRLNDPATSAALTQLDRVLYQDDQENWDGRELAKLVSEFSKHKLGAEGGKSKKPLPDLYA
ncbi:MAG: protein BatD [Burkholderiales bacterium]|nr:protein BatD [Burkholderiales bacterium]